MSRREWFRYVAAKADKPPEVFIYGDIGTTFFDDDGVSAQAFVDMLADIDAPEFHVRINSPGGSAWDGLAIANAMIRHPAKVTTFVDGMAASAASVVMLGGDEVVVNKWGRSMLHNARALVMGTADDMREVATQIEALNANMATFYADRSTGDIDAAGFARAMAAETWYNAEEMLAAGLATRVDTSGVREEVERAAASVLATTRMKFVHPPTATTKEHRMATKDDLAKRLGKNPADVTDEDLMAAALEALGEAKPDDAPPAPPAAPAPPVTANPVTPAAPVPGGDTTQPPAAPATPPVGDPASAPASAAASAGTTVTVDAGAFTELQRQAALGAQAFADAQMKADKSVVERAIDEGRIPLASMQTYLTLMSNDRTGTTKLLTETLPKGTIPLQEIGHASDVPASGVATATAVADDPRYQMFTKGLI